VVNVTNQAVILWDLHGVDGVFHWNVVIAIIRIHWNVVIAIIR